MMNVGDQDQAEAWMKDQSAMLWDFFDNCIKQGFKRSEALALTRDLHVEILRKGS